MPRIVIIDADISLQDYYQQILKSVDARFHNQGTTFQKVHASEAELGELEAMAAHAAHAGESHHTGTHIERLLG